MRNAFTSLRRDSFLSVARIRTPGLYSLLWQAYYSPTRLFFDHEGFASETGIQQGDPIGATLFALSVDEAALGVQLEFNVWYFDDATFGNSLERIHNNLVVLLERLRAIDLEIMGANVISPFSMTACHRQEKPCSEGSCRWLGWLKRVTFYCWESRWIYKAFRELFVRRGKRLRVTLKLEVRNPHQTFVLLKNAFVIPKLQYVLRASLAYLCKEELHTSDRVLYDSLGRVTNVSLEGDVCKQAWFSVSFGGLGCRRTGDIALASFLASMNFVGELVGSILSRIKKGDNNELAKAVEFWGGIGVLEPDYWPRRKKWVGLGSMLCRFRRLEHYWILRAFGLPLPLERALMFIFLILAAAAGGWTVGFNMGCPAYTVLTAFQCIR